MRKSKSKHPNAQTHAVYSKFLILDGEDPHEFQELVDDLTREWQPEGTSEHDAVLEMAKGIWRKGRFQLFLVVEAMKNARNPDHPSYDQGIGLKNFLACAKISPRDAFSRGDQFLHKEVFQAFAEQYARTKFKTEAEWLAAVENAITSSFPFFDALSSKESYSALRKSAATFSGDLFDQAIAIDERLNAMIDKAIKRLVQIKASKQVLGVAPADETEGEVVKLPERKRSAG
jgi:hypothetical protein